MTEVHTIGQYCNFSAFNREYTLHNTDPKCNQKKTSRAPMWHWAQGWRWHWLKTCSLC